MSAIGLYSRDRKVVYSGNTEDIDVMKAREELSEISNGEMSEFLDEQDTNIGQYLDSLIE